MRFTHTANLGLAALAVTGLASALVFSAAPAFGATGNEAITAPISIPAGTLVGATVYSPPDTSTNNPDDTQIVITGTGYTPEANIAGEVCDGKSPTSPTWSITADCDPETSTANVVVGDDGTFEMNDPTNPNFQVGVFRGEGPEDLFNCLASDDNPQASTTADSSGDSINPNVASWGSQLPLGAAGGGTNGCYIRIGYSLTVPSLASDKYIPLAILSSSASPVTVTTVKPNALGGGATKVKLTITGTGFAAGATVTTTNAGVTVVSTTFVNATTVDATVTVSKTATVGKANVTVTNTDNASGACTGCLTIHAAPTIKTVLPSSIRPGKATTVTITGTHFVSGAKVTVSGTGITVSSVTFVSATKMTAVLTVASNGTAGTRTLTVTNPDHGKATKTFTIS